MPCDDTRALLSAGMPPHPGHVARCEACADLRGRAHLLLPYVAPTPDRLAAAHRARQWRRAGLAVATTALLVAGGAYMHLGPDDDHGAKELAALVDAMDALDAEPDLLGAAVLPGDALVEGMHDDDALEVATIFGDAGWP